MMALGIDDLFSNPGYWLEATVLVVFFIIVNMFPCVKIGNAEGEGGNGVGRFLPTPVQAFTDSLGRESTNQESCFPRQCMNCLEMEAACHCPSWTKKLVAVRVEVDTSDEEAGDTDGEDNGEDNGEFSDNESEAVEKESPVEEVFETTVEETEEVPNNECEEANMVSGGDTPPKMKRKKKSACNSKQTRVMRHCREKPLGGYAPVRAHCRYLPYMRPEPHTNNRSRSSSRHRKTTSRSSASKNNSYIKC